ncbi:MAG TPA: methylenetetrahydrofolate--tRNA-(uracil(54)-C(5))-methyltransferase (FADH(2)-oxidizing) TrmFO [Deltaproteobacteria bacterium]|nr:methylenetetrahydrofolate--tRNA-(uracil(54)-C(5))-methyltransferase (FADH(2)-oxidizing) TrmFO [Deltaproteobacteria bacterium]
MEITVIGGGLAGCEAAWQAVRRGLRAVIYEMRPLKLTPAHRTGGLAELVCSNSLKSEDIDNGAGLLKEEMRRMGSLVVEAALGSRVPAGKTLAVDREAFSHYITGALEAAGVEIRRGEVTSLPAARPLVIATGPLTAGALADEIRRLAGGGGLYFYDAVAPIVYGETIDMDVAFAASRYGRGGADYINCPMTRGEYERFAVELLNARRAPLHDFDREIPYYRGCMPIEAMVERGLRTPLFGPLRPVGLTDPRTGERPYAVVQLRREDREGRLFNMVGFQTRLAYDEQKRVFTMIPGLERARFARLGKIHRNSYIDSPRLLTPALELRGAPGLFFAGQITGVEGYCESAAMGIVAGMSAAAFAAGAAFRPPPRETMTGSLAAYITDGSVKRFQPMNANFGLLPGGGGGRKRRAHTAARALRAMERWLELSPCN